VRAGLGAAPRARPSPPDARAPSRPNPDPLNHPPSAAAVMYAYCSEDWKAAVTYQSRNAPTFAAFASIIAFLVVFRQNFSIARYNDGRRHLAAMTAAFYEGASFAFSFDNGTYQ
jgi:hypothetical protein